MFTHDSLPERRKVVGWEGKAEVSPGKVNSDQKGGQGRSGTHWKDILGDTAGEPVGNLSQEAQEGRCVPKAGKAVMDCM